MKQKEIEERYNKLVESPEGQMLNKFLNLLNQKKTDKNLDLKLIIKFRKLIFEELKKINEVNYNKKDYNYNSGRLYSLLENVEYILNCFNVKVED